MKKPGKQRLMLAAGCLVSGVVAMRTTSGLEATEFSGGWLTGPLLSMSDIGTFLFALAVIASFVHSRSAGIIGIVSSLLCLPLYLYLLAPVPFNQMFGARHEFKVQPSADLHWDGSAITGLFALAATVYACLRSLTADSRAQTSE